MKKYSKSKHDTTKLQDEKERPDSSPWRSSKKMRSDKKIVNDDSDGQDDRPKKRKRVIRIDPHDISNKRLDDDVALNGRYSFLFLCS